MTIIIPNRDKIYLEINKYFDDLDVMFKLDDEDLADIYSEVKFIQAGHILTDFWEEV